MARTDTTEQAPLLVVYQESMPQFAKYDAQVLGLSVDGVWCHAAFAKNRNLRFPLLADFEPKGRALRALQEMAKSATANTAAT